MPELQSIQYFKEGPATAEQVLETASNILADKYLTGESLTSSQATCEYLQYKLGKYDKEVFAVLVLNSQHQLITYKELFFGTIDAASVYPREVVKEVLNENGAAVIFAHNHPSGDSSPSQADIKITKRLKDALALFDIRVLDHIVVGRDATSLAEQGSI